MRLGQKRVARSGGGESSFGTLFMLLLLAIVACAATFSAITAIYGPTKADLGNDDIALDAGWDNIQKVDEIREQTQAEGQVGVEVEVGVDEEEEVQNLCRGQEHLELWGEAVKWGNTNLVNTSHECCQQCKEMCATAEKCECNSWVYCGNAEKCGENYRQCWLKRQDDVLKPEVHSFNLDIPWTSGIIHPPGKGLVALETPHGSIRIKLFSTWAPNTVGYVRELLQLRFCTGCQFYRAEGLGPSWNSDGSRAGQVAREPPYALLQGTLQTEGLPFKPLKKEAAPRVRKGHVCLVGDGPDFFISLADHSDWGHAHTVFGEVLAEDLQSVVPKLISLPTQEEVWNGVKVLALKEPVSFSLKRHDQE